MLKPLAPRPDPGLDITPPVDTIPWTIDPLALAEICCRPTVWPTVRDWCLGLQRAHEAIHYELADEERQRKANRTETDRVNDRVQRELAREKRRRRY